MKIKSFDGTEIYYEYEKGREDKPVLVFLHGVAGNLTLWKKELEFFKKKKYSTLAVDLRGHGNSSVPKEEKDYFLLCFVKDVRKIIQKEKINNFVFLGHSFGGSVAISYLVNYNKILPSKVILVESTYRYPYVEGKELNCNPLTGYLFNYLVSKGWFNSRQSREVDLTKHSHLNIVLKELYYLPLQTILYTLHEASFYSKKFHTSIVNTLKNTDIPFMFITGDHDETIDKKFSLEMHSMVKGSKLRIFKNADHLLPIEKSEKLCKEIVSFIK